MNNGFWYFAHREAWEQITEHYLHMRAEREKAEAELNRIRDYANQAISDGMQADMDRTRMEAELAEARKALEALWNVTPDYRSTVDAYERAAALLRGEGK